ncbi:hypothetical protein PI124_g10105 [Phytophthora idaei]|nr:hypothetical protein PI125_g13991 [Phytophthora idaei]KAG3146506.1 hypothetical protein PI126_g13299 [Phytophthora idaei]KAG3245139.1 hypothetical protein PI124_g10105 [Phytophthora idaei]
MPRQPVSRRRELTEEKKAEVVLRVQQNAVDGVPRLGTMKKVAAGFCVVPRTVSRIWKRALKAKEVTGLWSAASLLSWRGCGGSVMLASVRFAQLRLPVVFLVRRCIAV